MQFKAIINHCAVSKYCNPSGQKQATTGHAAAQNKLQDWYSSSKQAAAVAALHLRPAPLNKV